jgi:hypothetical protein
LRTIRHPFELRGDRTAQYLPISATVKRANRTGNAIGICAPVRVVELYEGEVFRFVSVTNPDQCLTTGTVA